MRSNITRMRELNPNKAKEMEKIADAIQKKIDSVGDIPSAEGYKKVPDNVRYGAMRGLFVKKEIIADRFKWSLDEINFYLIFIFITIS